MLKRNRFWCSPMAATVVVVAGDGKLVPLFLAF
jgi:hypothetical protein